MEYHRDGRRCCNATAKRFPAAAPFCLSCDVAGGRPDQTKGNFMAGVFTFASEPHPVWTPFAAEIHKAVWDDVGLEKVREFVHQWMKSYESAWDAASSRRCMRTEQATNQPSQPRVRAEVIEHWAESLGLSEDDCSQRLPTVLFGPLLPELPFPELPLPLPHRRLSEPERWAVLAAIHDYYLPDEQISPWPREQLDGPVPTWQDERDYEQHREEEKKRMAEDLAGVHYWRLVARVDELTEYDKPVIEGWLVDVIDNQARAPGPNRPEALTSEPNDRSPFGFQPPDPRHSDDFTYVCWYKTEYEFTKLQAACVKVLWDAWENKTPVLKEETILDKAGSLGSRLRDVFKEKKGMNAAWGTMIVSSSKGCFRLREPEKTQSPGKPQENPS